MADAARGLTRFQRGLIAQIIEAAACMGLDIGHRLVFLDKVIQHPSQQGVFVDICRISGVVMVLITEHSPC